MRRYVAHIWGTNDGVWGTNDGVWDTNDGGRNDVVGALVITGLDPAIHGPVFGHVVDARITAGHDGELRLRWSSSCNRC
jgi:hypothetical protein